MSATKSHGGQRTGSMAALALLAGCTQTLPAPEAGAFRTIATLSRDGFSQQVEREYDAQVSAAARELHANRGRVVVTGCERSEVGDCTVTYTQGALSVALVPAAPNARALIGGIATYGTRMAELAEAKDLEELRAKAEAASGAAKALAAVALPAGPLALLAGPLIDAGFWAGNARRVDRRRRALLEIALATQPAIDEAAETLSAMATPLRDTPIVLLSSQLENTRDEIELSQVSEERLRARAARTRDPRLAAALVARADRTRDRRDVEFRTLLQQQARLNALRTPGVDYGKLAEAHHALTDKLSDPHVSIENAMKDLDVLVATAGAAAAAARPRANTN